MTLKKIRKPTKGIVRNQLVACPLCGHEFAVMENRWRHFLNEHGPEDAGLAPSGEVGDSGEPLFDDLEELPGGEEA